MNIVRIKLTKPNSFWFLNDLHLGPGNSISEPFDLDAASPQVRHKINRAEKDFGIIEILEQPEGIKSSFDINADSSIRFELPRYSPKETNIIKQPRITAVATTAIVKEKEMPELRSFTIEPEPEPEIEQIVPSGKDNEEAKALLIRNGNTIKRVIKSLDKSPQEARSFLLACLEVERADKNRPGIIKTLEEAFIGVS